MVLEDGDYSNHGEGPTEMYTPDFLCLSEARMAEEQAERLRKRGSAGRQVTFSGARCQKPTRHHDRLVGGYESRGPGRVNSHQDFFAENEDSSMRPRFLQYDGHRRRTWELGRARAQIRRDTSVLLMADIEARRGHTERL
jgi:hypothetical protein